MTCSVIDLLDRLVTTGMVADGEVVIALADVELIRLDLQLALGSIGTQGTQGCFAAPATGRTGDGAAASGLAGLVLVVIDIVRRLLECQALRRMQAGTLTAEEVERLGKAFMALERQTAKLARLIKEAENS